MKQFTLLLSLLFLFEIGFAQNEIKTYKVSNNESIDVEFLSTDPDEIRRVNAYVGPSYQAGKIYLGGISYEYPSKFLINTQFGLKFGNSESEDAIGLGFSIDANYFFYSKLRPSTIKRILKPGYEIRNGLAYKLMFKEEIDRRVSHGIHLGFTDAGVMFDGFGIAHQTIAIGYSYMRVRHLDILIGKKKVRKKIQTFDRLTVDVLLHRNIYFHQNGQLASTEDWPLTGARVFYDLRFPLWFSNGRPNIQFILGAETLLRPDDNFNMNGIFGFGFGYRLD